LSTILKQYLTNFDFEIAIIEFIYGKTREGDVPQFLASIEKGKIIIDYAPQYPVKKVYKRLVVGTGIACDKSLSHYI
jgi:UDP-N-acetylglucosamine/UDP-N-acetylgalactosamine 4-epimerase